MIHNSFEKRIVFIVQDLATTENKCHTQCLICKNNHDAELDIKNQRIHFDTTDRVYLKLVTMEISSDEIRAYLVYKFHSEMHHMYISALYIMRHEEDHNNGYTETNTFIYPKECEFQYKGKTTHSFIAEDVDVNNVSRDYFTLVYGLNIYVSTCAPYRVFLLEYDHNIGENISPYDFFTKGDVNVENSGRKYIASFYTCKYKDSVGESSQSGCTNYTPFDVYNNLVVATNLHKYIEPYAYTDDKIIADKYVTLLSFHDKYRYGLTFLFDTVCEKISKENHSAYIGQSFKNISYPITITTLVPYSELSDYFRKKMIELGYENGYAYPLYGICHKYPHREAQYDVYLRFPVDLSIDNSDGNNFHLYSEVYYGFNNHVDYYGLFDKMVGCTAVIFVKKEYVLKNPIHGIVTIRRGDSPFLRKNTAIIHNNPNITIKNASSHVKGTNGISIEPDDFYSGSIGKDALLTIGSKETCIWSVDDNVLSTITHGNMFLQAKQGISLKNIATSSIQPVSGKVIKMNSLKHDLDNIKFEFPSETVTAKSLISIIS